MKKNELGFDPTGGEAAEEHCQRTRDGCAASVDKTGSTVSGIGMTKNGHVKSGGEQLITAPVPDGADTGLVAGCFSLVPDKTNPTMAIVRDPGIGMTKNGLVYREAEEPELTTTPERLQQQQLQLKGQLG